MEIVEHVEDLGLFIKKSSNLLKKNGIIFDYWSSLKGKFNKIKKLNQRSKYFEL